MDGHINQSTTHMGGEVNIAPVPEPDRVCMACGIRGHTVRDCVWTSDRGDMPSCPFCETCDHRPEACHSKDLFDADDIWDLFVLKRAGKSQVRTMDSDLIWPNLVRARLERNPDEPPLALNPHSRPFSLDQSRSNPLRFKTHEYGNDPRGLEADPRTADRAELLRDSGLVDDYVMTIVRVEMWEGGRLMPGNITHSYDVVLEL